MLSFSIQEIAHLVKGMIEGNSQERIYAFGKIENAKKGEITFLSNLKYESFLYTTQASCVLVAKDYVLKQAVSPTLIRVENPYVALTELLTAYKKMQSSQLKGIHKKAIIMGKAKIPKSAYIGAGTVIEEGVSIGENTSIYPLCYIGKNVRIADHVTIYPHVTIYEGCQIGAHSILHAGAVIGADGFGYSPNSDGSYTKIPQIGIVVIEENVEIGANTTIDRATMGTTLIKAGAKIDNLVQIAHNVEIGNHTAMAAQSGIAGSAKVGNHVLIGGQAGISGHLHIGDKAMLGPQTGVIAKIKEGAKVIGAPAMPVQDFLKCMVLFKQFPSLAKRIEALEKTLAEKK